MTYFDHITLSIPLSLSTFVYYGFCSFSFINFWERCGFPLVLGIYQDNILEESGLLLSSSQQLSVVPQLGVDLYTLLPSPRRDLFWFELTLLMLSRQQLCLFICEAAVTMFTLLCPFQYNP